MSTFLVLTFHTLVLVGAKTTILDALKLLSCLALLTVILTTFIVEKLAA